MELYFSILKLRHHQKYFSFIFIILLDIQIMITTKIKDFQNTNDYDISIYKILKAEVNYLILIKKRN